VCETVTILVSYTYLATVSQTYLAVWDALNMHLRELRVNYYGFTQISSVCDKYYHTNILRTQSLLHL